MSTLYKPVLIETAEQAAALPSFTLARYIDGDVRAAIKTVDGTWESVLGFYGEGAHFSEDFAGWTALVPIEAEEVRVIASGDLERDYHGATVFNHTPDGPRRDYRRTEFHTPWEEA